MDGKNHLQKETKATKVLKNKKNLFFVSFVSFRLKFIFVFS